MNEKEQWIFRWPEQIRRVTPSMLHLEDGVCNAKIEFNGTALMISLVLTRNRTNS
ncbi:hypothetical protein PAHAL_2G433700 [Panicum hallii]|uniref:Uncharacterized protein n=1 Tax=Panicum hallii TaxID=206008 RepID=A0A2T8KSH9_9POAL|nr:hypothetical protein PAHAL_2G433700 [Panicum hallii]